jgi:uncharacterized protein
MSVWFVLLILLLWNGLSWLVLGFLMGPVLPGGWLALVPVMLLLGFPIVVLMRGFSGQMYPSATTRLFMLRPFWYGQLFLPLLAIAGLAGVLVGLPFGASGDVGRGAISMLSAILIVLGVWGYLGTKRLVVRVLEIPFAKLPRGLDGLRIVQLSDLHVGPHTPKRHLRRVVEAVERANADLIVLTGDQVDDFVRDVEVLRESLGGITAPLGVIAVAGNHDVYAGWNAVQLGMERIGWTVLVNEAIPLRAGDGQFWIAGTGDPAGHGGPTGKDLSVVPDVRRTMARVPSGAFVIALAHNPALWPDLAASGVDLTLSGHTHYGQFAVPKLGWSVASPFLKHAMDMHREGDSVLYINPGTNYWGIPFRIGTLPEVTVITLRHDPAVPHL